MTTLVTGFEPFGTSRLNSSGLLVDALRACGDVAVVTGVLPTSYRRAETGMLELLGAHRPDTVVMFGLSSDSPSLRLEQVALNLDDSSAPDNDGDVRIRQRIAGDAPAAYWSSLPLEQMAEAARQRGEEAVFSRDAGGYVCNHVFFTAAHLVATRLPASRCGFVHLPALEPGERLDRLVGIVRTWIALR